MDNNSKTQLQNKKVHPHFRMPQELTELSKLVGEFIQYWGFKNIHGQIWLIIFLSKEPIDSTTLVKRLGVSKALVSLAIKDLLEYEVIQQVGLGSRRKILFQSHPDLIYVITQVLKKREQKMLETISSKQHQLKSIIDNSPALADVCPDKLDELGEMVESASSMLSCLIDSELKKL